MKKYVFIAAIALLVMVALSAAATAQPQNATTITRGTSERATSNGAPSTQQGDAGNTTALHIIATENSKRWQGFYGNVTGNVTLGDSSNNVLYNWVNAQVNGEVYAANHSNVNWDRIYCVNFSANHFEENFNKTTMDAYIGYTPADLNKSDTVNETFRTKFSGSLAIGSRTIVTADECPTVTLNTGSGPQSTYFQELLLTDNQSVVFGSILENAANGFKNHPTDFEMIVGVNGTVTGTTRNYYFYVELS